MPRLVLTHRLEHAKIRPFAVRRRTILLQQAPGHLTDFAQFRRSGADNVARHDGG